MIVYTLQHILKKATQLEPNKIAFKYLDSTITFTDLNTKTDKLAQYLRDQGVQKGDRVGIYMPRCLETTIAVYGILKAGGVYVPLDPFAPVNRTKFIINDCDISHLVSIPQQIRKLKKISEQVPLNSIIGVEQKLPYTTTISWDNLYLTSVNEVISENILGDDLAYILYTSGSTGTPKGIMHTHTSALAFVKLAADMYRMKNEIYGMHAPLHFDPSVQGYFAAPYAMCTTIIVSDAHTKMPTSLAKLIEKEKITIWFSVPLVLIQLLSHGKLEDRDMSSLKWVLFSGEVFTTKHLQRLMKLWPFAKFSNIYGPTETNQCTYYHLNSPPLKQTPIPIGYVWGDTSYKLINEQDQEVSPGDIGELVVRTATMMKGYWKNPTLTAQSLYIEEALAGVPQIYYRTGDLVQLDTEGRLLFLGRNDCQVKLRGYRIELGEIENVCTSFKNIQEAVAFLGRETGEEEEKLIAAVLHSPSETVNMDKLKDYFQKHLPQYAIPDKIVILEKFTRTASGKINRKEIKKQITVQHATKNY